MTVYVQDSRRTVHAVHVWLARCDGGYVGHARGQEYWVERHPLGWGVSHRRSLDYVVGLSSLLGVRTWIAHHVVDGPAP